MVFLTIKTYNMVLIYIKDIDTTKEKDVPLWCLDKEIRDYLESRGVNLLTKAYIETNKYYVFIYLENGNRLDIEK